MTVGVALLTGLALLAGAWWASHRAGDDPSDSADSSSSSTSAPAASAQSTAAGPSPERSSKRTITMRPYPIPQNNYDPRTDKLYPDDTAPVTFECRRRTSKNTYQAGCIPNALPVFVIAPNKSLDVVVAEVPQSATGSGFPAACEGLGEDNDDFVVIAEKHTYCAYTDKWVAVIRVEDLPGEITSSLPVITVDVSYWSL